jgi:D-arabinose 1-dehydrogenase-like Zn-dependent alcohol dehydrogenase
MGGFGNRPAARRVGSRRYFRAQRRRGNRGAYDRLLWGERQIRSVANMTRVDASDFLRIAGEIGIRPQATIFSLERANDALAAIKSDLLDGAAVIVP